MKLLLDQGLPRSAAALLRRIGIDTVHVGEIGLAQTEDAAILEEARRSARIVITLDADFHALMAISGAASPSVIRIRIEGLQSAALSHLLQDILSSCRKELEAGVIATVQPGRVRLRRLPLRR
ncbi:MAG: DUF5615 family PIN-like protein [Armatimonadetes bacterium]|nr:DUF5615 family PIN-like protein [Armatimonadota bacterium]